MKGKDLLSTDMAKNNVFLYGQIALFKVIFRRVPTIYSNFSVTMVILALNSWYQPFGHRYGQE